MGATAKFGLPYPEPTDLLRNDATALRVFAETVADRLDPNSDGAAIGAAESDTAFGAGASAYVHFPGAAGLMSGFSWDGVTLTRTGPARLFLIHGVVGVSISSAGTSGMTSFVRLLGNGNEFGASVDAIAIAAETLTSRDLVHTITSAVRLVPGDTIQFLAGGSHAGGVTQSYMRALPIGPRESA